MDTIQYYRFEYRFENALLKEIERVASESGCTRSGLMRSALREAGQEFSEGLFHYRRESDFLCRWNIPDRQRFEVVLDEDEREVLRKLAFTWRISQAEVMRIVMEYYVYVVHGETKRDIEVYSRKIRYTVPRPAPMLVIYDIMNIVETRFMMFTPPKAWTVMVT